MRRHAQPGKAWAFAWDVSREDIVAEEGGTTRIKIAGGGVHNQPN